MTYDEAMIALNEAAYKALRAAIDAHKAADSEDGAPVDDIEEIKLILRDLSADVDCLIDHNATVKDFRAAQALYKGAKLAGLV